MKILEKYRIDIFKLSNEAHEYHFEINSDFFSLFAFSEIKEGKGTCDITLEKTSAMITLIFKIDTYIELVCDRSLDEFDYQIQSEEQIMFKYGDEEADLSDDVKVITQSTQSINIAHHLFEMIATKVPMKKLHPRFESSDDDEEVQLIYTSEVEEDQLEEEEIDPRWAALKNLNK
ncbi:MAG: DUF177 domain-containing protein [Bacteroidota bacterium]